MAALAKKIDTMVFKFMHRAQCHFSSTRIGGFHHVLSTVLLEETRAYHPAHVFISRHKCQMDGHAAPPLLQFSLAFNTHKSKVPHYIPHAGIRTSGPCHGAIQVLTHQKGCFTTGVLCVCVCVCFSGSLGQWQILLRDPWNATKRKTTVFLEGGPLERHPTPQASYPNDALPMRGMTRTTSCSASKRLAMQQAGTCDPG